MVKILSRQDLEDTPMNRIMLSEVRSIRMVLEGFSKQLSEIEERVEHVDHLVLGNGSPGIKTDVAVLKEQVAENKGRAMSLVTTVAAVVAVIGSVVALLK